MSSFLRTVLKEECGVFGVYNCLDAAHLCFLGLYSLQHRGQEAAGIVSTHENDFYVSKDAGLVSDVFDASKLSHLVGRSAIGHVRYSTTGSNNVNNIQPFYSKTNLGNLALAHNGNITNAANLFQKLKEEGALFQSTVDSEVMLHLLTRSKAKALPEIFCESLAQVEGAFSVVFLGENFLCAARDSHGFRPLVIGKLGEGYVVASETCAFDLIGATYLREVAPGEVLFISEKGLESYQIPKPVTPSFCIFEYVYFARPDSKVFGENVHLVRKQMGHILAQEHPVEADLVMAIPDSGNSAALGFSEASGIPFEFGMTRNHYVGRTFIQPKQDIRDLGVKVKLNPISDVLKGKRVVVIDDSIVRGTTSKQRVKAIRDAGAIEVHVRISSPPITDPCYFGIDTPDRDKLIASQKSIEETRAYIGADSLGYLSQEGLLKSVKMHASNSFCMGCFSGKYPLEVKNKGKFALETGKIKLYAKTNRH